MSPGLLASLECHYNVSGSGKGWFLPPLSHGDVTHSRGQQVCALTPAQGLLPGTCPAGEPGIHHCLGMDPRG